MKQSTFIREIMLCKRKLVQTVVGEPNTNVGSYYGKPFSREL